MPFNPDRYQSMQYRRCGKSGLQLPAVSLGGWQGIGGYRDDDISKRIFFAAFDLGITHFDFANNYGHPGGASEELFGRILKEMPRHELVISSKAGYRMWPGPYGDGGSRKYLIESCDESLQRLGVASRLTREPRRRLKNMPGEYFPNEEVSALDTHSNCSRKRP